jgi:hypothetical protein
LGVSVSKETTSAADTSSNKTPDSVKAWRIPETITPTVTSGEPAVRASSSRNDMKSDASTKTASFSSATRDLRSQT